MGVVGTDPSRVVAAPCVGWKPQLHIFGIGIARNLALRKLGLAPSLLSYILPGVT